MTRSNPPRDRLAAVLEVLGVYLAGQLVMMLVVRLLGIPVTNPLTGLTAEATGPELVRASWQLLLLLGMQYAGWFVLILPLDWWRGRRSLAVYGLTRAGQSWKLLVLAGLATAAVAEWPTRAVELVNARYHLGDTVPWRQAIFDMSWMRWEFWLFSAIGSFALIPIIEELFYRGYCQRRLAEAWGDGPAIAATACLFAFSHGQYLTPNAYNAAMMGSALVSAVGFGVVYASTRSLVPSIVAHAVINVPMTPAWQLVMLVALLIGVVIAGRRALAAMTTVFRGTPVALAGGLAVLGAGYAVAAQRVEALVFVAVAMVIVAALLGSRGRGRETTGAGGTL